MHVQDLFLNGFHAEAEVTDYILEDVVVGDLLELERPHQLEVDLCSFNPGVDILSVDEVLLRFYKIIVVQLLLFEPVAFVLTKQSEEAVSHAL